MSRFQIGDRFRVCGKQWDIALSEMPIDSEGVILGLYDDRTRYDWYVLMDTGRRWYLKEDVMAPITPPLVSDVLSTLGL